MQPESPQHRYWQPKYWPTWGLILWLRSCAVLPYPYLLWLGRGLGCLLYYALRSRRRIAQININACFPELSTTAQQQLLRDCFRNIGIAAMESALAWWGSTKKLQPLYSIDGLEHIQQAQGRPILLLTGHLSCTEIGARLLAQHIRFQAMYKPAKNKLFEAVVLNRRSRFYKRMVGRKQSRILLKNLLKGDITWYAPDQNFGHDETVFAPFFGVSTITLTATARIAERCNALVIPYFCVRLPGRAGYKITIQPPLQDFPSGDMVKDATTVNHCIEQAVRQAPAQYLWLHKRFRHRPPGEPALY